MARFRRRYGAGPLHLAGLLVSFAVAGFAISRFFDAGADDAQHVFVWLIGGLIVHDFVFLPLYSLPGRVLSRRPATGPGPARFARARVHMRVPTMLSGLLLLVFYPVVLRRQPGDFGDASGLSPNPFLHRWLIVTVGLFVISGAAYAVRAWRTH